MKILILGATGLVGKTVLEQALESVHVEQVIAPTRRSIAAHPKLYNPVAPDLHLLLPEISNLSVDAVICAMGTTIGKAGSKEAFRYVDYVLPVEFAKLAHRQGAQTFALVSSPGASVSIPLFYCRTKGEVERDIQSIGFKSLTIVRPGMIGGHRDEFRLAERLIFPLAAMLRPVLPRALRINPASNIAKALLDATVSRIAGVHMITSKDLA